ncbi:MAG: hypothetical protein M3N57_02350 [Actinomycetota bacterium]|nr:hypothetical protein [Actinomycetota bacterium]
MSQLPLHDAGASCTLDEQGAARRSVEFANVVERGLRDRKRTSGGVRLTFDRKEGLEEDLRELVRRESGCCAFFSFDVDVTEGVIVVEVAAPAEKDAYLEALYRATEPRRRGDSEDATARGAHG